jgi:hypothetical protein
LRSGCRNCALACDREWKLARIMRANFHFSVVTIFIRGMWGLGDNIYQRPFVRELASSQKEIYLETPWPELYEDIPNVYFVRGNRALRTQLKNMALQKPMRWSRIPTYATVKQISYNMRSGSIITDMAASFGLPNFKPILDLPKVEPYKGTGAIQERPIALIRPVTVRTEWTNTARNPLPEYIEQITRELMKTHYVILVADVVARFETLVGNLPAHHAAFIHGQLILDRLLALVAVSDIIVGGVGWIVPASIAAQKRAFIVLGGQGGHNRPEKLIAPYWEHQLGFAIPEDFCQCVNMKHNCSKTITNLLDAFARFQMVQ